MEFSLHGLVGIRFVDPSPSDLANIIDPLRLTGRPLDSDADIVVRFAEEISTPGLNRLGLDFAAFDARGFYILHQTSHRIEARIPFEDVGEGCEILCRSGLGSVPLLSDIIAVTFMKKGYVHLHASAFSLAGKGVLVAGWSGAGKTDALLAFVSQGAKYLGDELVMLSPDGELHGIPIALAVWDWQFPYVRELIPRLSIGRRLVFRIIHGLDFVHSRLTNRNAAPGLEMLSKALPTLRRQLKIWLPPQVVCGAELPERPVKARKLFLMMTHDQPDVVFESCDAESLGRRMIASNEYERLHMSRYFKAFRFAFPESHNEFFEHMDGQQRTALLHALRGVDGYLVKHPHGLGFDRLFREMRKFCD